MSDIICYLSFSDLLSMKIPRFIHVAENGIILFIFVAEFCSTV